MARTHKDSKRPGGRQRRISVRGVHRDPVDLRKLSRALIALAQAQAEADARAERETRESGAHSADDEDGHGD